MHKVLRIPVLLDFFVRQLIIKSEATKDICLSDGCPFKNILFFDEQISGKGYPLLTVGNSLFSTSKSVNTSIVFIGITPCCFQKGQPPDYPYHVLI